MGLFSRWRRSSAPDKSGVSRALGGPNFISLKEMVTGLNEVFTAKLGPLGFKGKSTTFIRERQPGVCDWISIAVLTYGKDSPFFRADIHIGIRCEAVEKLTEELLGKPSRTDSQTFSRLLGYVMPQERPHVYELPRETFPFETAKKMVEDVIVFGLPYLARFDDWNRIYEGVSQFGTTMSNLQLPMIMYFMRRPQDAIDLVEMEVRRIENRKDQAAEIYRERADRLIEQIKGSR